MFYYLLIMILLFANLQSTDTGRPFIRPSQSTVIEYACPSEASGLVEFLDSKKQQEELDIIKEQPWWQYLSE